MRLTTIAFASVFALAAMAAQAGVAPNTGASQMSQSGAKIAPKKDAAQARDEREASREQDSIR
jgi:hypothetical protein